MGQLIGLIGIVYVLYLVVSIISFPSGAVILGVVAFIGVFIWALIATSKSNQQSAQVKSTDALITKHVDELSIKQQQTVRAGSYGLKNTASWEREKRRFIDGVVAPKLGLTRIIKDASVSEMIDSAVSKHQTSSQRRSTQPYSESLSPTEYEKLCAALLADAGWKTRTTKASGDQGADVIAERSGVMLVLQCKKYSQPVGNAAVQQIHAACGYYGAQKAAVVSNAAYTASARALAAKLGVELLHHNELSGLASRLKL